MPVVAVLYMLKDEIGSAAAASPSQRTQRHQEKALSHTEARNLRRESATSVAKKTAKPNTLMSR